MLARCLAVTPRSIDRAMTEWMRQGWMSRKAGLTTFRSRQELEERADPDRMALFNRLQTGAAPR